MLLQGLVFSITLATLLAGMQLFVYTNSLTWRSHRIDRLLDTQIGAARENFRASLAGQVKTLGANGPFAVEALTTAAPICARPSTGPSPSSNASPCPFDFTTEATSAGDTTQPITPQAQASPVNANNIQTASFVDEQRVSAIIVVSLLQPDGFTKVAERRELVTARTFGVAPYAAITGVVDLAGSAGLASEADSAGCDPNNTSTCAADAMDSAPDDTRIHAVKCHIQADGSCPPESGTDAFSTVQWQNPNRTVREGWRN